MSPLGSVLRSWLRSRSIVLVQRGKVLGDEEEVMALEDAADLARDVVDPQRRPTVEIPPAVVAHMAALCGMPDTPTVNAAPQLSENPITARE